MDGRTSRTVTHSSHWGAFQATVDGDRLVGATPFPLDAQPSPMLGSIAEAIYHPSRVSRPAIRRSWLEGGPGSHTDRRGAEPFVEVSWEQALDLVAGELERVRREHGNQAIFGGSYGWASAGRFHHAKTQLARFLNCFGGCTAQVQNYSYAAAMTLLPHIVGTTSIIGMNVTSWPAIVGSTRLWVMFGGTPARNLQVESGGIATHTALAWLERARASGTEFVSISPIRGDAPAALGARWLPIRPGTDTALMLGLARTLLSESLHHAGFLERYCVGFDRFARYLAGEADGQPKTAAWAAALTGVEAGEIEALARRMAGTRTMISSTWSLQRADHGEQPYWMTVVLAAMLGQIGLPGGGFGFGYGNSAGVGNPRAPFGAPDLGALTNPTGSYIPVARIADMLLNPGGEYAFDGQRRVYPDIRLVYWAGGNPFHHHQDLNRLLLAWQRPETIVVHEPWWTATARHADIVLPATTTLERNDIGASSRDCYVIAMRQAIGPVAGSRSDHDILRSLAERVGISERFTEGRDEMGWLRHIYDDWRARAAEHDVVVGTFDDFWERGYQEVPKPSPTVAFSEFRQDPDRAPLQTPSGRIEIFSETIEGFSYPDCPGHPVWLPPAEWLGSELAQRYPLHLVSHQPATRLHAQLDMAGVSRHSKVGGREPCMIHPADAARRGIRDGDVVRLFNDRGECLAGAVLSEEILPGVVCLATGAWYDPSEPGKSGSLERHGNPNILTADRGTSRLAQGPSAHSALIEVERCSGLAPEPKPFEPPQLIRIGNTGKGQKERTRSD